MRAFGSDKQLACHSRHLWWRYDDGEITVLDRAGVGLRSCECYGVVKNESDRLLAYQSTTRYLTLDAR
jgi:hypothetical protein